MGKRRAHGVHISMLRPVRAQPSGRRPKRSATISQRSQKGIYKDHADKGFKTSSRTLMSQSTIGPDQVRESNVESSTIDGSSSYHLCF